MILYLDCIGGIAGDMLMAALIDAGASFKSGNLTVHLLMPTRHLNIDQGASS